VGIGDQIIATGMAKGFAARGKRAAFGDGTKIRWDHNSPTIFKNNPNVAPPGSERDTDVEWVHYYKGRRRYSQAGPGRWIFNYEFKAELGELFFDPSEEVQFDDQNLILVEPNVPLKPCAPNKQWPVDRWERVVAELTAAGFTVRQFDYGRPNRVAPPIETKSFRHAAALLRKARAAVLHEGGLHHAAAAVGCPAVVLFGGFVPPSVLGYDAHVNLTGGVKACGSFEKCDHCVDAMRRIQTDDVLDACERILSR
jgi:hypothetical protein